MRLLPLFILFLYASLAFSQPARKMVKTKSRYLVEQYEVLTTNDTLRTGSYRKYFREGNLLLEEGQYDNNQRTGVWTFYDEKGRSELVYDYSTHTLRANNRTMFDSLGVIQVDGKSIVVRLDPPPVFLASSYQISGILMRESRLPIHLHKAGISELSYQIMAIVSPAGAHYRVLPSQPDKDFSKNAREWALLAFENVKWLPGVYEGKEVTAIYTLPAIMIRTHTEIRIR